MSSRVQVKILVDVSDDYRGDWEDVRAAVEKAARGAIIDPGDRHVTVTLTIDGRTDE